MTGGIYFTMAITVERYFTVCHPFYRVSHSWPAKAYVIPIVSFALIYNIPKFFEIRTRPPLDLVANNVTIVNNTMAGMEDMDIGNATGTGNQTLPELSYLTFYENGTVQEWNPDLFDYGIEATTMRMNQAYYNIYCMWLNFLFMGLGPFILLITLNSLMLHRLKVRTRTFHFWHL